MNDGGLSLPLRTNLRASRSTTGRNNRLHDDSPGDILGGVDVGIATEAASLADKFSLTLAVSFLAMSTHRAGTRGVARINRVQWDTRKSSLVLEEEPELPEGPTTMLRALRAFYRALRPLTDVSKLLDSKSLFLLFCLLNNPFANNMVGVFAEAGFLSRPM
jgi:hypothetical protein